jgi:peptidoglycan-associated lipoprotein
MRPGRSLVFASIVLLPLLAAGCKKKIPDDTPDGSVDLPPPSATLQVAAVDPAFAPADRTIDAEIFGSGFESGARVSFSGAAATSVRFVDENALRVTVPAMAVGSYDVTVTNPDGTKSTLRKGLTLTEPGTATAACGPATVAFDFDSTVLSVSTRRDLDTLASCLRDVQSSARIEGHCDDRGTTEYNIALGQRRADAVHRYLVSQGVAPGRLRTVSYGEERPADSGGSDAAHAKNRRAEISVRE